MKNRKPSHLLLIACSVFVFLQQATSVCAAPIVQPGAVPARALATRGELSAKEFDLLGLQFNRLTHPSKMRDCERGNEVLGKEIYTERGQIIVLRNFRCSGRNQYWLIKPVDKSGKSMTPREFNQSLTGAEDDNDYVVENIYVLPKLSKDYTLFSQGCMRNHQEVTETVPFAFAIGTTVPIYENDPPSGHGPGRPGEEIGYKSKHIVAAWMVNVQTGKFEPMPTKGLFCSYAD
jgi:hypothetical protein